MANGHYQFSPMGATGKVAATSGTLAGMWGVAEFIVQWLRHIDPAWLWPENLDEAAINALIIIGFSAAHYWADYRRGTNKYVLPGAETTVKVVKKLGSRI